MSQHSSQHWYNMFVLEGVDNEDDKQVLTDLYNKAEDFCKFLDNKYKKEDMLYGTFIPIIRYLYSDHGIKADMIRIYDLFEELGLYDEHVNWDVLKKKAEKIKSNSPYLLLCMARNKEIVEQYIKKFAISKS